MSQGGEKWVDTTVRGDRILWLSDRQAVLGDDYPAVMRLLCRLDLLRDELNNAVEFRSTRVR